jgi:WD40 repeat protein
LQIRPDIDPKKSVIISGSEDGNVYIWDVDYISSFGDLKHNTKKIYSSESFVPFRERDHV